MVNVRIYFLWAATVLLIVALSGCQELTADKAPQVEIISTETNSRTVEDGGTGPYTAVMVSDSTLATHTIFRPEDLSVFGKKNKLPIIAWGNGACSNSPSGHLNFLSEVASHGFLVIAIGPMPAAGQRGGGGMMGGAGMRGGMRGGTGGGTPDNSGINMAEYGMGGATPGGMVGRGGTGARAGQAGRGAMGGGGGSTTSSQLIDAIDWAIAQDSNQTSIYYNKIDTTKIAVSGMSCGGLQALEVGPDERITTLLICNSGIFTGGAPGGGMRGGMRGGMQGAGGGMRGGTGGGDATTGYGGMPGGMMGGMIIPPLSKDDLQKLHSPIIYILGGESDMAYVNGTDDFRLINHIPAFVASYPQVGHGGTYMQPHGGEFAVVATAWCKWQLKGDNQAGKMFTGDPCGLSQRTGWVVDKKNIP